MENGVIPFKQIFRKKNAVYVKNTLATEVLIPNSEFHSELQITF